MFNFTRFGFVGCILRPTVPILRCQFLLRYPFVSGHDKIISSAKSTTLSLSITGGLIHRTVNDNQRYKWQNDTSPYYPSFHMELFTLMPIAPHNTCQHACLLGCLSRVPVLYSRRVNGRYSQQGIFKSDSQSNSRTMNAV